MRIPSREQAEAMMAEAGQMNPGPWTGHSAHVAAAAQAIARRHPDLDPEAAWIMGYLHDIGRREGVTGVRHIIDGYDFLVARGFDDAARVCLTHSYPEKEVESVFGPRDWTAGQRDFIARFLSEIEYTPYDRLFQLCDSLALPSGICLMEKRFVDVALRYGCNELMLAKWRAFLRIRDEFDRAIGQSIYSVLPGVIETTFGHFA